MPDPKNPNERAMFVPLHRRNYVLGIINGILVQSGNRLLDPMTMLPLLLLRLSGLTWIVGVLQTIIIVSPALPALFAAPWIDTAERKLPIFKLYSIIRFFALLAMAGSVLAGAYLGGTLVAALVLVFFASWFTAQAVSTMAFMDIVAKSTPTTMRGSFWMWRQIIGLFLVLTVAVPFIHYMVGDNAPADFPTNYGILLLVAALVLGISWLVYFQVKEPASKPARHKLPLRLHIARGIRFWRHDPRYRRMVRVLLLLASAGSVGPFFMALAVQQWSFPDTAVATFITVQILAQMGGSVLQGRVSDRLGNRAVLVVAAFVGLSTALVAVCGAAFAPLGGFQVLGYGISYRMLVLCLCFAGSGIYTAHIWPGQVNYLLDIAPERKRPSYLGFTNLFIVPVGVVPLIFGWLAQTVSILLVFGIGALLALAAALLSLRLHEPRDALTTA